MTALAVEITLVSPALLAAAPPASNLTDTLVAIPGNTLRGVLARRYLERRGGTADALFGRLFLAGGVRYGLATLCGAEVMPLSARS